MNEGFKVVERIGGGEYLDIWCGVHQITNTNVNIQILDRKKIGNAFDNNRFTLLCDLVLSLDHPNVLKYFKVVSNEKSIAIVTEPIQGRSLRDYLMEKNNKRLSESEARMILRQIVEGASFLHSKNIVHRNLTLHNIYISNQGEIKLGNLLICVKNTDMYKPITNQKSDCHFFSPEIWDANQELDASCDLWSIGVILYVLVCGCYPFDGKNEICVYLSAKHARFMIPNFITSECSSLIRQLLMPAKEARMKLEEIKYHPWYNNLTAPILRPPSAQNSFGYSLHSIPESLNENEEVKQEENPETTISLSDFAFNYPFNINIPLDIAPNASAPILMTSGGSDNNNNNNNNDTPPAPSRRRYSYSTPTSPQPPTLEEFHAEQNGTKITRLPSRKRSAGQEQLLTNRGNLTIEEALMIDMLGTTPPQPRKRTNSINENKDILHLLEMPPPLENDVNSLRTSFASLMAQDTAPVTTSQTKTLKKKNEPSSPKSNSKGTEKRTYRRRSLDDFSHLMGPNSNPDLPTFNQVFPEPPKESSFGFQPQVNSPHYSPTMGRNSTIPQPISHATSVPLSPVIYPGSLPDLTYLEHQMSHFQTPDLPVQPPKITPMVFYPPDIPSEAHQFLSVQYPYIPGGLFPPPQNSQFDMSQQYFPMPGTDSETLNVPIDTVTNHKHVSNFLGNVIPETEEEWANNVVNRKYDVTCLADG